MTAYIQVTTTTDNAQEAEEIARHLVQERLAACVQVSGPVTSTYWWEGKLEKGQEWLCVAKTRAELYNAVESAIHQVHSYEVPEILVLPVLTGSEDYLKWLDGEVKPPESPGPS